MADLDLGRRGGDLTGSSLDLGRPGAPEPVRAPSIDIGVDPIADFAFRDKLKFLLFSGLGGMGGGTNTFLAKRQSNIRAREERAAAEKDRGIKILEVMIKGANAINGTAGFTQKLALRDSIVKQLSSVDPRAGASFKEIADSPSITEIISDPKKAEFFGGLQKVLTLFEGSPDEKSALKRSIIEQNRGAIHDKILRLQGDFPNEVKLDLNADGITTHTEAMVWVRRHHESKKIPDSLKLTPTEMEVFQFDEFEDDLASAFGVRTRKAVSGAQEKGMVRAVNSEGESVFATEEQLRLDPGLKPEPKAPLVQFGENKKSEALFGSLVKRRDALTDQASSARTQKNVALQMRATAERVASGVGVETIVNLQSFGSTLARVAGMDNLAEEIQVTGDAEVLRSLNARAVSTVIRSEKQGQVSNAERATIQKSLPGLATSKSGNIAMSHILDAQATSKIEEAAFIDTITNQVANGKRGSDIGANQAFTDYVNDLPRTKGDGEDIRHIDDKQSLWRYYIDGKPSKWIFPGGDFTLKEIEEVAQQQGLTTREFLAVAERKGTIQGVIQ